MEKKDLMNQSVSSKQQTVENSKEVSENLEQKHPSKLEQKTLIAISELIREGYSFGRIKFNREIDLRQVKKKIRSIEICKGIISPVLVVPASDCLKSGLELVDCNDKPITKDTPDVEFILIVIDGQHRMKALKELNNRMRKEGNLEYEGYCYLPLINHYNVVILLRETNVSTDPWDGMDWLTQLLANASSDGFPIEKLEWVKEKAKNGSDAAAWAWVNNGKVYTKSFCIKASKDSKKLETLADTTSFNEDKKLYDAASKSFTQNAAKVLGWKILPIWLYGKLDELVKKDMVRSKAIALLAEFIEGIGSSDVQEISTMKKTADQSKDYRVSNKLDELFAEFEKTIASKTTGL